MRNYCVYILASGKNGTLYIGVTNDIVARVSAHKRGDGGGFTAKYRVDTLVHFELTTDVREALEREKRLKNWKRAWKIALIEQENPSWRDLYTDLF